MSSEVPEKKVIGWPKGKARGPMSDAHKAALSDAVRGRRKSAEHREKIRLGMVRYRAVEKAMRELERGVGS